MKGLVKKGQHRYQVLCYKEESQANMQKPDQVQIEALNQAGSGESLLTWLRGNKPEWAQTTSMTDLKRRSNGI